MAINFAAASTAGLNNPGAEIIPLNKDESGNFINPPSYDKMRAYLRSGEVPMLFVTAEGGKTGSLYQLAEYSETENKIRFSNDANAIEFCAGCDVPVVSDAVQPDWNQNDSTAADYVKNRPFYTGDPVETVFVEESTVSFADGGGIYYAAFESTFIPAVGDIYTVYWDGAVYECACVEDVDVEDNPMYLIGNLSIDGLGSDTGEPFIFTIYANGSISAATKDASASHTFSISRIDIEIVKIPAKYLPVASEIEPGIMSVNYMLQQVRDEYFTEKRQQVQGYVDAAIIEESATHNNSYNIYSPKKFNGAVLSYYNNAVNNYLTVVLSGSESIECWKLSQSTPVIEKLWGIHKDGVIISSSVPGSTKKFKITIDDSGAISATEVT